MDRRILVAGLLAALFVCSMCAVTACADQSEGAASISVLDYNNTDGFHIEVSEVKEYSARVKATDGRIVAQTDAFTPTGGVADIAYDDGWNIGVGSYSFVLINEFSGSEVAERPFTTYAVSFDANGGSGTMDSRIVSGNYVLPTCGFGAPDGQVFAGWMIGSTMYDAGFNVYIGSETVAKAVWTGASPTLYTVTWKNYDGNVLKTDTEVPYGTTPEYSGDTPSRASTDQYTYVFAGWDPEVVPVSGDATYTAKFTETVNKYTVSVSINDTNMGSATILVNGAVLSSTSVSVDYGTSVTVTISQNDGYRMIGLKDNGVSKDAVLSYAIASVEGNHSIEVDFKKTSELQFTVTIVCPDHGGVTPSGVLGTSGAYEYRMFGGQSQTFVISADFGYVISDVVLLGGGVVPSGNKVLKEVKISNIQDDVRIEVQFAEAQTYDVNLVQSPNGDVTLLGLDSEGKAVEGRRIIIDAVPDFGYSVKDIIVNGTALPRTLGGEVFALDVDENLHEGTISIQVTFAFVAGGDEDDDPILPGSQPTPDQPGSDDGDSLKIVAVAAACVAVAIIAIFVLAERRN